MFFPPGTALVPGRTARNQFRGQLAAAALYVIIAEAVFKNILR
jgi:hypothetical protein